MPPVFSGWALWAAGAGGSGGEAVPGMQPDMSHGHQLHLGIGSTCQNGLWEEFLGQVTCSQGSTENVWNSKKDAPAWGPAPPSPLCPVKQQLKPGVHPWVAPAPFDASADTGRVAEGGRSIPFLQGGFPWLSCVAVSHLPAKYSPPACRLERQSSGCAALIDRSQGQGCP